MREHIKHDIEKITVVSATWPFPVKDSKWSITQESSDFPEITHSKSTGEVTSCEIKGGKAGCQLCLMNHVLDEEGKPYTKEWWVDTFKQPSPASVPAEVKTSVKSK